jgi:hypothetical protein
MVMLSRSLPLAAPFGVYSIATAAAAGAIGLCERSAVTSTTTSPASATTPHAAFCSGVALLVVICVCVALPLALAFMAAAVSVPVAVTLADDLVAPLLLLGQPLAVALLPLAHV